MTGDKEHTLLGNLIRGYFCVVVFLFFLNFFLCEVYGFFRYFGMVHLL